MNKMFLFFAVAVAFATAGKLSAQSLPEGLLSKCECESGAAATSYYSNMEFRTPQGFYYSITVASVAAVTVDSTTLRISQGGNPSQLTLPITKREMYGPQLKLVFSDGGYALLTPSVRKDRWTMVRLYKSPDWESSTGTLYLTYY